MVFRVKNIILVESVNSFKRILQLWEILAIQGF